MTDSQQLLREYVESGSDSAFRELVRRYIDLVYSVALRRTDHDTRIAEDIAQTVFTDLARKSGELPAGVMLGGWLHKHTCFVAANVLRSEKRRTAREQQALEMNMLHEDSEETWKQLAPILDDAIQELAPAERDVVVLRFFEQRDFRSVGAALGVSDDTAQKRVSRALEKLRELLVQRGITMGVVALGTALADRSLNAAPASLGATIAGGIKHSPASVGKAGSAARVVMLTAIMALLLVVATYPTVSGRIRSWLGTNRAKPLPVLPSVFAELPNPTEAVATTDTTMTNATVQPTTLSPTTAAPNTNVLTLTIVADDSGKPVPNVPVEVRWVVKDDWKMPKVIANRMGIATVPLLENTSELQLTTQIEGFADTRLLWNMDRGQKIPDSYTVRLVRPLRIGGRVLGPDNEPVAGAKVGFNHREQPLPNASVESHNFTYIAVTTDSDGRWQINRIAPELVGRIHGSATHPDYAASRPTTLQNDETTDRALRDGTHIFQLGKAMSIRGVVEDADGNPIMNAKVLCGGKGMSDRRETTSAEDGAFTVKGVKTGETLLTAEAKGFAATTIPIEITKDAESFRLTLVAGKTLRLQVLDTKGNPVAKAYVWLNTMNAHLPKKAKIETLVQATFDKRTDATGRIVWEDAPDTDLTFDIAAAGYMRLSGVKVRPADEEHVITLQPALVVSGTVRDANSGKNIPKFRVICGWPGQSRHLKPNWSIFDRDWLTFEGGKFKHSFESPLIYGRENPGYQLKIEAVGYTPYVSQVLKPNEGEVDLEVSLQPANTPLITVLLPDGQPAILADIGLVSPGVNLEMTDGGFNRDYMQNGAALSQTDRRGQFQLPGDEEISRVIIAHPQGCAETTPSDLVNKPIVYLQPWGRLEGTYRSGGKLVEGREFTLQIGPKGDDVTYSFTKRVKSDANGKFIFPQVLPGTQKLFTMVALRKEEKTKSFTRQPLQEVEIESGQTTTVDIGGSGYTVQARFTFSGGTPAGELHTMGSLHTPFPMPPVEIRNDRKALQTWRQLPDIAGQLKTVRSFPFTAQEEGMWVAENVLPGEYGVMVHAFLPVNNGPPKGSWSGTKANVVIPNEPATGTLDLGEIVLQPEAQ